MLLLPYGPHGTHLTVGGSRYRIARTGRGARAPPGATPTSPHAGAVGTPPGDPQPSPSSRSRAVSSAARSAPKISGTPRPRRLIRSTRIPPTRARRANLRSAGTTYHSAHSVEVVLSASS